MVNIYDFLSAQGDDYKILSFKEVLFAHYQCPQKERYTATYTHHNSIVYVINGAKAYHSPGKSFTLHEGGCFFIKKGACIQERFHDKDWVLMAFFLPDNFLKQLVKDYQASLAIKDPPPYSTDLVFTLHVQHIVKGFFDSMLLYFQQRPKPSGNLIELKCRELLVSLLSDPANAVLLSYINHICNSQRPPLEEIMESNYRYNLSLAEFARIAQRSLATFNRDFASQFNTTPGKWLTQKRLQYAQLLLDTTKKNVNEVAGDCGFENTSHFSRAFKEKFGKSPSHYRSRDISALP